MVNLSKPRPTNETFLFLNRVSGSNDVTGYVVAVALAATLVPTLIIIYCLSVWICFLLSQKKEPMSQQSETSTTTVVEMEMNTGKGNLLFSLLFCTLLIPPPLSPAPWANSCSIYLVLYLILVNCCISFLKMLLRAQALRCDLRISLDSTLNEPPPVP